MKNATVTMSLEAYEGLQNDLKAQKEQYELLKERILKAVIVDVGDSAEHDKYWLSYIDEKALLKIIKSLTEETKEEGYRCKF